MIYLFSNNYTIDKKKGKRKEIIKQTIKFLFRFFYSAQVLLCNCLADYWLFWLTVTMVMRLTI